MKGEKKGRRRGEKERGRVEGEGEGRRRGELDPSWFCGNKFAF